MKYSEPLNTIEDNIELIKNNYSLETRKKMIINLLAAEDTWVNNKAEEEKRIPSKDVVRNIHTVIDKIFSVILKNLEWKESNSLKDWDYRPMNILKETFPNIENTQWYKIRDIQVKLKFNGDAS